MENFFLTPPYKLTYYDVTSQKENYFLTPLYKVRYDDVTSRMENDSLTPLYEVRYYDVSSQMENDSLTPLYKLRCLDALYNANITADPCCPETKKELKKQLERRSCVKRKEGIDFGRKTEYLQGVQNKPFKLFYDEKLKHDGKKFEISDNHGVKELYIPTRGYKSLSQKQSDVIKKRPPTDNFLIRRPVGKAPAPAVCQEDILFKTFTKQLEFKLKNFPTIKEQYYFYQSNFPLLLDQYKETDRSKISIKRIRSPENAIDPELKRGIKVKSRLFDLKKEIDFLEEDSDCEFETELRTGTFDPTSYPWNKKKRPFPPGKASRKSVDLLRKASLRDT